MKNLSNTNLRDMATAMGIMKKAVADVTDGNIVGIDSVSGGAYMADLKSVGEVVVINKKHKLVVDAVAYPAHCAVEGDTSSKFYPSAIRCIIIEFDPATLAFTGKRTNVGYDAIQKASLVSNIWNFVTDFDTAARAAKAAEVVRAQKAKKLREQKARASKSNLQKSILNSFL